MARERKPLITPGSVLPPTDTLSRILERDRINSGRASLPTDGPIGVEDDDPLNQLQPQPPESQPEDASITSNITAHTTDSADIRSSSQRRKKPAAHAASKKASPSDSKKGALEYTQELAKTMPIPITLRLPEGLNDWLDDYAHQHRKQKVKKQDLVSMAIQLLVIELTDRESSNDPNDA